MSKPSSEELLRLHNLGEQDEADDDAKTDLFDQYGPLTPPSEEKDAYLSGVDNARNQK